MGLGHPLALSNHLITDVQVDPPTISLRHRQSDSAASPVSPSLHEIQTWSRLKLPSAFILIDTPMTDGLESDVGMGGCEWYRFHLLE